MATTTSITTTYAGEFAGKYISAALLSGKTLAEGNITTVPNVKYKQVMKKVATDDIVKDATCDFTDTSTLTLTERILTPEEFQVNLELCKKDFRSDWEAAQMGYSAFDNLPNNFSDFLIAHVADKVAQRIETNIWTGTNATAGQFDGFITTLGADSDVVDVTGTASTASNIITELGKIADAIPSAVYGKEDLKLYVSKNVYKAYIEHLAGFGAAGVGANGYENRGSNQRLVDLFFNGIPVFVAEGLTDNKMVAAQTSNLFFGTSLLSALQEVKLLDMADIDGSNNFRFIARFFQGATYGVVEDIVLYA